MVADYAVAVVAHRVDLLVADETIVGLVELVLRPGDLLIENVAVSPSHQGRGHGRALIARAEAVASEAGRPAVRLYTNALFVENVRFYRELGYGIERQEPFRGGTIVHMLKAPAG